MIDINCDMGEGIGNEAALMPYITSANIACGGHAGDETTMRTVARLCLQHQVHIGAHPSYPDRENFGRTDLELSPEKLYGMMLEQVSMLKLITAEMGGTLRHVKPHGALYNRAAKDPTVAKIVAQAVKDIDPNLVLFGLSGSCMINEAAAIGLRTANEVFADRTYQPDGSLTPRLYPNALITDPNKALKQVQQMIEAGQVTASDGQSISIKADTVCIHGDGTHAMEIAQAIHSAFGTRIKKEIQ